ncbi:hypothetical protein [Nonomuraea sp. LPB2021202275-12-8]|uniref:hypothetical protein n=1 Tax=Nonomuraea sp. LPB2021202275-12-8 TaxID=3120159 RepID=UPI00300DA633
MLAAVILTSAVIALLAASASATPSPIPSSQPTASPTPSPHIWIPPAQPAGADECSWVDIGCKINEAVNGLFTKFVTEAVSPAFVMIGRTLLWAPPPSMFARVHDLSNHVRLVANALLLLFVLAGGVIVMAYGSVQTSTTTREIVPRLVVATIMLNLSLVVCEHAVQLSNALVAALLEGGVDGKRVGDFLAGKVGNLISDPEGTVLYLVLMVAVAVVMATILVFVAILRMTLLLFLIIVAPLALLCHALPQTEGMAKLWWRAITGLLAMQVLQALALVLAFKVFWTDAFLPTQTGDEALAVVQPTVSRAIDTVMLIGLLYVLIKIPSWVARTIWRQAQPQLLKRLLKTVILYKTLGAAKALGTAGRGAAARKPKTAVNRRRPSRGGSSVARTTRRRPHSNRRPPTGAQPVNPSPSARSAPGGNHAPQQLALPLGIPPQARASAPASPQRGRQLALPFPVTRVPRPPASAPAPPLANAPWIRPRPPYVQDMLPGMPRRRPRPGQLRLRLDPPPRRVPRRRNR